LGTFQGIARLLKKGGRVVFLEPNPYNVLYYLQMMVMPHTTWQGDKGIIKMRKSIVFDAMQRGGFAAMEMRRFGFFPPFLTNRKGGTKAEAICETLFPLKSVLPFQLFKATLIK